MKLERVREAEINKRIEKYREDKFKRAHRKIVREQAQALNSLYFQKINLKELEYPKVVSSKVEESKINEKMEMKICGYDPKFYEEKQKRNIKFA